MALRGTASQANTVASTSNIITVGGIGIQLNDIVLLATTWGSNATITPPGGFSVVPNCAQVSINAQSHFGVWYKVAGASEPSTYTATGSISDLSVSHCRVYSGRNSGSPFTTEVATAPAGATLSTTPVALTTTGLTAAAADDIVLFNSLDNGWATVGQQPYLYAAASGYANGVVAFAGVQFTPIIGACDKVNATAGATGTLSPTLATTATSAAINFAGFLISLVKATTIAMTGQLTGSLTAGLTSTLC